MDEEASDVEPSETMKREIEEDSERDTKFLRTDSEEDEKPVKLKNEEERLENWDSDSQSRESLENGEGKPPEVTSEDPFPAPELPLFPKRDEISRENGEEKPFSSEKPRFSPEKPAGEEENGENEDENVNVDLPGEFPHSSESSREAQCSPAEGEEPEDEDKDLTDDPTKSGKIMNLRKNIKDVLDPTQLDASTLAAQREESERLARVQEQQRQQREQLRQLAMDKHTKAEEKVLQLLTGHREPVPEEKEAKKEIVTIEDSSSDDDCIVVSDDEDEPEDDEDPHNSGLHTNDSYNVPDEKGRVLVNFGHATDEPDVFLAPQIAKIIKPHQIGGIRFLFDNIIESVSRYEQSTGYGCILAHSMGLGKTIQVVSFSDIFLRHTSSRTILIIMPINTLQNWLNEFNMWVPETSDDPEVRTRNFKVFLLNDNHRTLSARAGVVLEWAKSGGVLMIGYEMYRLLSMKKMARSRKKKADLSVEETAEEQKSMFDAIHEALVKPGPDLVICDEGHRIKNSHASISVALKQIKSRRRVVLTGYPLQNNLLEYWCMVDFVRPNYLGTKTEFSNMFERPIQNGQCVDSTPKDIQLMRFRAHVLHSLLVGFVQRRSHFVLQQSLPAKQEYVVLVRMTDFQRQLYETFMNEVVRKQSFPNPLKAFSVCCKIWNHPDVLFNFLRKRELDLDLELDEETTSSVASKKSRSKKAAPKTPEKPPEKVPDAKPAPPPAPETPQYSSSSSNSSFSSFQSASNGSSSYQDPYYYGGGSQNASYRPGYQGQQQHYGQYQQDYYQQQQYGHGHGNYYGSQYGGYYGSQYGSSQSQNYYQGYGNPPGNYEYPYPYQYPQDASAAPPSDTKKEEKAPEPAPVPKTVESEFENKLADEIKEEVESKEEKADGKGKDDSIPYEWASELMKGYVPDLLENSPKMEIFLVLLEESVRSGDRVLLFSQSLLTLNVIEKFLQKKRIPGSNACWAKNTSYFRLDGSTVAQERERLINSFNANKGVFLFLVSTRAGSLGINLVGANRVIVFDASWNPCHDTQAVCRVYRYGQQKPCFVYRIVMDACLEKKIYDRQISKQGMSDRVVDECNPDAHLSMKEVTSFCFDDDEVTEVQDFSEFKDDFASDTAMQKLLLTHSKHLTKKPFQHESLLVDNKEKKLSASEKRMAKRGYEMEKMQASKPAYSYTTMGTTYRAYRTPDGSLVHKAVNQGRSVSQPVSQDSSAARGQRPTTWIPAEVWQQQGMSAQEMTLPSDVVIPTSSADKENIVLKAGQRVMVLKSHKGIYMQLESGKIIAIRTAVKPDGTKKGPSEQPGTSSESSNSSISKTETVKSDTDDDDIIMTSITYPDPPQSSSNQPGSGPNPRLAQSSATLAATAGPYMNGRKPPMTETGRRRGRPPTYNGYHPSYIPPGVVPQPLQPYSHASAKNFASSTYDKPTVKESYIPPSQTHSPLKTPQFAASEGPNASEPMLQPAGSHFNPYQPPYGSTRPFEQQPPVPPPPYPQNQPPAQTNGGQQSIHQWQ